MIEAQKRFWQTQRLIDKESVYLQDVAQRLFVLPVITPEWIENLIASPEGRGCHVDTVTAHHSWRICA